MFVYVFVIFAAAKKPSLTGGNVQSATLSGDNFFIISDADSIEILAVSKPLFPKSILLCLTCKIRFSIL